MKLGSRFYQGLALAAFAVFGVSPGFANDVVSINMANSYEMTASSASPPAAPAALLADAAVPASKPTATPVENQPAGSAAGSRFLVSPGDPVVGPGTPPAPVYRVQNSAPATSAATSGFPILPAVIVLLGAMPAVFWIVWNRSRPGRRVRKSGDRSPLPAKAAVKVAAEPGPALNHDAELSALRLEVMGGLKEMRTRTEAFTDALETGLAELQTELARARRTVVLLREERLRMESRLDRGHADAPGVFDLYEIGALPEAMEPIRTEPKPLTFANVDPKLDPAWQLLDDPSPGIVMPRAEKPAAASAPLGAAALRSFTARPAEATAAADFRRALDFTTPAERRDMILSLARAGRSIDDIARQVKVGRGEVTLALTRARDSVSRVS